MVSVLAESAIEKLKEKYKLSGCNLSQRHDDFHFSKSYLLQLIGLPGSGARRLALKFAKPEGAPPLYSVIWISPQWNLYAPLLWKLADELGIKLLGLECPDRNRWRMLWRELIEAQVFDAWILDNLQMTSGEAAFLQKLTRRFSVRIIALDDRPRAVFSHRAHICLSHHSYRVQWMKGGSPTPQFFNSPFLESFGHPQNVSRR